MDLPASTSRPAAVLWVAVLYSLLTLALAYPLPTHLATYAFRNGADTGLLTWILAWDAHAFLHQPFSIFEANIYYPAHHTLAFGENLIGSAFISAPVYWITGNPVLAMNIIALTSCVLCGIGTYLLGRRLGMSSVAAMLAGLIFAFSPPRFFRIGQLHLAAVQWIPFGLASLHAYLDRGRRGDLWLAAGFFTLEALCSGHGAVFMTVAYVTLLTYRIACGDPIAPLRRLRDLSIPGILLLLPTLLAWLPYRSVQREGLKRTLDDWVPSAASFLASPSHFHQLLISLAPSLQINERAGALLFPGFLPILLALVAFWPRRTGATGENGREARVATRAAVHGQRAPSAWRFLALLLDTLTIAGLAAGLYVVVVGPVRIRWEHTLILSVGSAWRLWLAALVSGGLRGWMLRRLAFDPLRLLRGPTRVLLGLSGAMWRRLPRWRESLRTNPATFYAILAVLAVLFATPRPLTLWPYVYSWPGFNFIRVPSRFGILLLLCIAVLAGLGFDRLFSRVAHWRRTVLAGLAAALLVVEFAAMPLNAQPYAAEIPAIDRWLDTRPKPFAIAEIPLGRYGDNLDTGRFEQRQSAYMIHAMAHWQKTIHGFSGFRLPLHEQLFDELATFPDARSLDSLARLKIDYVVVHTGFYPPAQWRQVEPLIAKFGDWLKLEHVEGDGRVYSLHRPRQQ